MTRVTPPEARVLFRPRNKEGAVLVNAVQSGEVQIATVHHVEGTGIEDQVVEDIDVVNLSRRKDNHGRDVPAQRQQRVQLDRRFGSSELGPREQREAQVDGGGVQRVGRLL
jgi:hypothetical protein